MGDQINIRDNKNQNQNKNRNIKNRNINIKSQTLISKFNKFKARMKKKLYNFLDIISIADCNQKFVFINVERDKIKKTIASVKTNHNKLKEINKILKQDFDSLKSSIDSSIENKERLRAWALRVKVIGKCDICSDTKFLTAHHLWDKKTHPTLMYQDENGVCLCKDCHNGFHRMYTSKSHVSPHLYSIYKIRKLNGLS